MGTVPLRWVVQCTETLPVQWVVYVEEQYLYSG